MRMHDAGRLLAREPALARASHFTAQACGEPELVRRLLDERPEAASEPGGPRSWPPILYLCAARLPSPAASEHAVAIARLLLDRGADPNAFVLGGNADIHYTALTLVLGRGEEQASMHPRAPELARLLLERGANPHDSQVLYNVFADNTSRHLLGEDIVWLLELLHEHSVRRGHRSAWDDPEWPMFDMRGAPSLGDEERRHAGAHFMLSAAVDRNLLGLAAWMLAHGAGPNTPPGNLWPIPRRTLHQEAMVRGHREMAELLARHGAVATPPPERDAAEELVAASMSLDRARVRSLLARHPELRSGDAAMRAAVRQDRADVVAMLLDLGVSPDVEDPHGGASPLHAAAASGAVRCAELLIARGADVDRRDRRYHSPPLGWASYFEVAPMVELLGRHSRDVWRLAYAGRVARLREVLHEEPALARLTSDDGGTPLMWLPADAADAEAVAALLLDHGADPTRRNARGETAAEIAERRGLDAVAALLRARGG
jgi:ankyrin repeat protein